MLEQIISEIKEAEAKADEMIGSALDEAKAIYLSAESEAEKIRKDAVARVKEERKKVVEFAEKEANDEYAAILSLGKKKSEELIASVSSDAAVDFIKKKVLERYVGR